MVITTIIVIQSIEPALHYSALKSTKIHIGIE